MTLLDSLAALGVRVGELVDRRAQDDPTAGDPLRGLLVSPAMAAEVLHRPTVTVSGDDPYARLAEPGGDRMTILMKVFDLSPLDVDLLLVALAPDVDRRFEPLYGYLNDDVSRRRASVALALELTGLAVHDPAARGRFHPSAPLIAGGLLELEDPDRPLPSRSLRVPERVVAHLLGDDTVDGALTGVARAGETGLRFDPSGADGTVIAAAIREARLRGTRLVVGPMPERPEAVLRALAGSGVPFETFGPGLDRHARRVRPTVGWDDLVLPAEPEAMLRELVVRARQRGRVLGDWRLLRGGGRGHGVVGLFAGESGTGKTLAAEVVAADLGVDLYVVDLSALVDKYIGETEKNLERVFAAAERGAAVLLFDEADAVFGKRSEVRDARDRYANLESAYLLQRLESFSGVALLTTNLRANIDDAFTRRLDLVIDFPFPGPAARLLLWRNVLDGAPCVPDLDGALPGVAERFELGGGSIRAAAVTAAYLAAARDTAITAADVETGARREYAKSGRLAAG
ncbi:hypothetical protein Aph02nite_77300 [Actinoplanes philippinensis]|uniref:ATPase family associated with various cellular activities (AAA) n=1 Tax=Actinoplanes philippinensis TaxID=35752 RepID=A0A1I2HH16_9ACTN|nr:AAA family ATPase [Actinoplanes philippinensis]GIE81780.1 hypothetical protein Aph02nite_77300 [Actinoplanes philippinensis]SFF28713.1 ATPase family associated with various cellular activities (AAA) [Actinoplanes philippinensis]